MEYLRFLKYHSLDLGSVLKYVMAQRGVSGKQLSQATGILPQRISDYINNRRKITAEVSLQLEKALEIDRVGYFWYIQSNNELYKATNSQPLPTPDLSKIKKYIFWDCNIEKLNWQHDRIKIIQRIIEYGDREAIEEISKFYGRDEILEANKRISDKRLQSRRSENISKYL